MSSIIYTKKAEDSDTFQMYLPSAVCRLVTVKTVRKKPQSYPGITAKGYRQNIVHSLLHKIVTGK
ncbi:hypothetical protein ADH70_008905 [Blautia pseudococcoides]|uniref:Uncharacterized protein n=1 Tax=Blautia pseudococcoides TaxID=1796616 RepID=A0A1C7I970_9FIRM|nr:hypothetical protein A4V09_10455 [Blautia pseudococcoides]ASU28961.1 hypothetical protein ADH70_008905 [Blautia pseudococcoides]